MDYFLLSAKNKDRFNCSSGVLSGEDLWDVPLTVLDELACGYRDKLAELSAGSFIKTKKTDTVMERKFEVVKLVIADRQEEAENRKRLVELRDQKRKLQEVRATQKDNELLDLSGKELDKEIKKLDKEIKKL